MKKTTNSSGALAKLLARIESALKDGVQFAVTRPEGAKVTLRKLTVMDVYRRQSIGNVQVLCEGLFVGHHGPHQVLLAKDVQASLGIDQLQMGMGDFSYANGTVRKGMSFVLRHEAFKGALAKELDERFGVGPLVAVKAVARKSAEPAVRAKAPAAPNAKPLVKQRSFTTVEPAIAAAAHLLRAGKTCELRPTDNGGALLTVDRSVSDTLLPKSGKPAVSRTKTSKAAVAA